jgi:hypothetical protein
MRGVRFEIFLGALLSCPAGWIKFFQPPQGFDFPSPGLISWQFCPDPYPVAKSEKAIKAGKGIKAGNVSKPPRPRP